MMTKNGTWKTISVIGGFVVIALGAAVAYGMLTRDVQTNQECVVRIESDVEGMKPKVETNTQKTMVIDRDIFYIQQDIEEIKTDNQEIKEGIKELLAK